MTGTERSGRRIHPAAFPGRWLTWDEAHDAPVDVAPPTREAGVRRMEEMPHARYTPGHPAPEESGWRAGRGANLTRWIVGPPRAGTTRARDLPLSRGVMDSWLEPRAAVGLHEHPDSAELYYLLEGSLRALRVRDGTEEEAELRPGDAHVVQPGESHGVVAGDEGVRFLVVFLDTGPPGS